MKWITPAAVESCKAIRQGELTVKPLQDWFASSYCPAPEEVAAMLFAFFGLGVPEIIILGLLCVVPVFAVSIVLVILQMTKKRPPPRDERRFPDDDRDPE